MADHSASIIEENRIRGQIKGIVKLLDAPQDLAEFILVAEEFAHILKLFRPISNPSETATLVKLEQLIDELVTGNIPLEKHIISARQDKYRKTMMPHYRAHPHYCVYWHRYKDGRLKPQYRALLASFLPVQVKLQSAKMQDPETFDNVAYLVGLHLRQLTEPNPVKKKFLSKLSDEAKPPAELLQRLEDVYYPFKIGATVPDDLKSFGYLHRVLRWFETGVWEHKFALSRKSPQSRAPPRHGNRVSITAIETTRIIAHAQEAGSPLVVRSFYSENDDLFELPEKDVDADPVSDGGKTCESIELPTQKATEFNTVDRIALNRRKARYAAQAIEMSNQKLPITHATLTGFELKVLLQSLTDINLPEWSDVPQKVRSQVAAWGASRFFIGRSPESLCKMHVQGTDVSARPNHLMWDPANKTIWLPCVHPRHKAPEDLSRVLAPGPGFTLNVADTLAPFLKKIASRTQKVFARDMDKEFSQLLGKINRTYGTSLTLNRVGNFIPGLIAQLAPNDEVMSVYFCGRTPNQHNPSVYSSVPAMRLSSLFERACERVNELAQIPQTMAGTSDFPNLISEAEEVVGSLHVPKIETLNSTIKDVLAKLENDKHTPGFPVHELHNAYTAYVLLFLLATTAIRAVHKPIPAWFNIDRATGSCFISEKDTDKYGNARVVWLHPTLIDQLDEYALHCSRLRRYLALVNWISIDKLDAQETVPELSSINDPKRSKDQEQLRKCAPALFMLSEYGFVDDILPNQIEELLGDQWRLRLVSLRHFLRTQLLQSGCSGTLINALLGHADRGEAPWGNYSSLPPAVWRKQIAEHLAPILDKLGFKVISSPLLRS